MGAQRTAAPLMCMMVAMLVESRMMRQEETGSIPSSSTKHLRQYSQSYTARQKAL